MSPQPGQAVPGREDFGAGEPEPGKLISHSLPDGQAKERFPQGWKELGPCLRLVGPAR
jgi:hypothetical protein